MAAVAASLSITTWTLVGLSIESRKGLIAAVTVIASPPITAAAYQAYLAGSAATVSGVAAAATSAAATATGWTTAGLSIESTQGSVAAVAAVTATALPLVTAGEHYETQLQL